jgi:alpha-tubulin suppressor-like RCC1 family protein
MKNRKTKTFDAFTTLSFALCFGVLSLVSPAASAATINATLSSPTNAPISANGYTATGNTVNFTLNFAPSTGTDLMVVNNTGLPFINGTFDNLTNGQPVELSYGGVDYDFVANYFGGSGNDLVLTWAHNRVFACGYNYSGQVGDNTTSNRSVLIPVIVSSALAGKTVTALAEGYNHSLALCSDGSMAAWGSSYYGQLGTGSSMDSFVPVSTSLLPGRTFVAIAAGEAHSLALCSDGSVAAWGGGRFGQLGTGGEDDSWGPVQVNADPGFSALAGKTVVAIAAGHTHSLALCSDGTVAAWGWNHYGELGNNTNVQSDFPVAVCTTPGVSLLAGKTVTAIAANRAQSLALCSDGTLATWGGASYVPVAVGGGFPSYLDNRIVVAITADDAGFLVRCSDGALIHWGDGVEYPDFVDTNLLFARLENPNPVVGAIAAGYDYYKALCLDGTMLAWGGNFYGQLGIDGSMPGPYEVSRASLAPGERFVAMGSGCMAYHSLALVASPVSPPIFLNGPFLTNGTSLHFSFTNTPGKSFTVLTCTNPAFPLNNWTPISGLVETSPGLFQFTDPLPASNPRRFYRVRSP